MNVQEREQLTFFLQELALARPSSKDLEAEKLIQETCSRQADALYLLVQRCLLLNQALQNSQAENSRLKQELENIRGTGGNFLDANAWGNSATARNPVAQPVQNLAPAIQSPAVPVSTSSWGSGVLGTVATTAAGVVAGSLLFQGIEHLIGNLGSGSSFSGGHGSPLMTDTSPENMVTDNSDFSGSDFGSLIPSDSDLGSL